MEQKTMIGSRFDLASAEAAQLLRNLQDRLPDADEELIEVILSMALSSVIASFSLPDEEIDETFFLLAKNTRNLSKRVRSEVLH